MPNAFSSPPSAASGRNALRRRSTDRFSSPFNEALLAAKAGEEWAWSMLINTVAAQLLGYAKSKGVGDPEDLVGDVFLRLAANLHDFEGDEKSFRAWTFTIAHRLIIDHHRRTSTRPTTCDAMPLRNARATDDPERSALERLSTGDASNAIAELPPDQADVIRLSVLGQLSTSQIAAVLDKQPGTVRALKFRATKRLNKAFREVTTS